MLKALLVFQEFFDEVEDDRPMLLPGHEDMARPFPPPPQTAVSSLVGPYDPEQGIKKVVGGEDDEQEDILMGPKVGRRLVLFGTGREANVFKAGGGARRSLIFVGPSGFSDTASISYEKQNAGLLTDPGGPIGLGSSGRIVY